MAQAGRQNLVCAVCREVYRSPRLLPHCHHSFCLTCLEGLAGHGAGRFPCPVCRTIVRVPDGGVRTFPVNFYISEEDLERERKQAYKPLCGTHPTEELIFFCQQCGDAICTRCKLTKHEGHRTVDLSEAADHSRKQLKSCRKRLDKSIKRLTKTSALCQDNRKAAKRKTVNLRKEIVERFKAIVKTAADQHHKALRHLDQVSGKMDGDLSGHVTTVQRHLDSLITLRQQVSHAIDSDNHAEVVVVERRVREGSVGEVEKMEASLPTSTLRPGVRGDLQVMEQVDQLFPTPVCLHLPSVHPTETVTQLYRCEEGGGGREVHVVRGRVGTKYLLIGYGGRAPDNIEKNILILFSPNWHTCNEGEMQIDNRKVSSFSEIKERKVPDYLRYLLNQPIDHSLSDTDIRLDLKNKLRVLETSRARSQGKTEIPFDAEDDSRPIAVDADLGKKLLVVLSDVSSPAPTQSNSTSSSHAMVVSPASKERRVHLYEWKKSRPVDTYTPPQQPFFPTDICFWREGDVPCPLLIADKATDSVHVVSVANAQFQFLRYLAHGSPDILRPTALCALGKILIGCENGWILRCDKVAHPEGTEEEEQEDEEEDEEEGGGRSGDGSSDGDSRLLNVENLSEATSSVHS